MRQYRIEIRKGSRENLYEIEVVRHWYSIFSVTGKALVPGMELANKAILEDLSQDPLEE